MKNTVLFITIIFCLLSTSVTAASKRVIVLISSHGNSERPNLSYDLEELAQTYLVLTDNGINVDIVSPKGGAVLVKNNKDDLAYIKRFKHETPALKQLANTIASKDVNVANYQGLFVVGGNGAMFDLVTDNATQKLVTHFAHSNLPIAAVCHGPAALVNIKTRNGEYFVSGKKVNSFTNLEEHTFGGDVVNKLPFLLEDKLKEHGAIFVNNAPMLPFVAVDNNLITAQNPSAVAKAAEALVTKLGLQVQARDEFKDEATLTLITQARASGAYLIDVAINAEPEKYDLNYLALYGFYSYKMAQTTQDKLLELEIMEAVARHFHHPVLHSTLIKSLHEQGLTSKSREQLNSFKLAYPKNEGISELEAMLSDAS